MVAVMFPDIASHKSTFEKILSMRILEWLVSLVGCKIYRMIEFEARQSRNSLVGRKKSLFLFFSNFIK